MDICSRIIAEEGVGSLWAGASLSVARGLVGALAAHGLGALSEAVSTEIPQSVTAALQGMISAPLAMTVFIAQTHREIEWSPHLKQHVGPWMLTGDVLSAGALGAVCWSTLLKIVSSVPSRRITERIQAAVQPTLKEAAGENFVATVLSGGVAGALAVIPLFPLGTMGVKVTAGLQLGTGSWSTSYAGLVPSVAGIFVYRLTYFTVYDLARGLLPPDAGPIARFAVGYLTTVIAGLASYPFDTLRKRALIAALAEDLAEVEVRKNQTQSCLSP